MKTISYHTNIRKTKCVVVINLVAFIHTIEIIPITILSLVIFKLTREHRVVNIARDKVASYMKIKQNSPKPFSGDSYQRGICISEPAAPPNLSEGDREIEICPLDDSFARTNDNSTG